MFQQKQEIDGFPINMALVRGVVANDFASLVGEIQNVLDELKGGEKVLDIKYTAPSEFYGFSALITLEKNV